MLPQSLGRLPSRRRAHGPHLICLPYGVKLELFRAMNLRRSRQDAIIAGVCGGLAQYLGWSSFRVRLVYVIVSVLSVAFPGIIVYLILWFLMPKED